MLQEAATQFYYYCGKKTRLSVVCHGQRVDGLERLLKKGVSVRYLLVPSPLAMVPPTHSALECRVFNGPDERMRVFHFAYAESPDLMWLEKRHPADSFVADDCEFVPPYFASSDSRLVRLKEYFTRAWEQGLPR